jgi:hypothetical protein
MVREVKTLLKVDLDLKTRATVIKNLTFCLIFMQDIKLLKVKDILSITLLKKNSYSVKIGLARQLKNEIDIILFQAILKDDHKRTGICYRDFKLGLKSWNRLFDEKVYPDGTIIVAKYEDVTKLIKTRIGKKKNG